MGTQPSSTAYQLRDLKGDLTSLGPGFPISLLPLRVPEGIKGEADEQQRSAWLSLLFLLSLGPQPSHLAASAWVWGHRGGQTPPAEFSPGSHLLNQESTDSSLGAKSGWLPAFVNKVLLERSRAHSYVFCPRPLSHHISRAE